MFKGTVEVSDQVKGLEAAAKIFDCIDMERVGVYGWSYGGYMSLMSLAQRPDIFKVAISGAPVTTWNLYDTAYTERYMGLPQEQVQAYENGSVLNLARNFPDEENRLLIIHGMIDENVHFAHTRKLIDALIKENKPYQLLVINKHYIIMYFLRFFLRFIHKRDMVFDLPRAQFIVILTFIHF